jgi:hypothetical protein
MYRYLRSLGKPDLTAYTWAVRILRNSVRGWRGVGLIALLAASLPLAASPLNVTNQSTASLNTDDALFFTLATSGFAADATAFGLSPYPTVVSFSFVTSSPAPGGTFDALLETPSGSVAAEFPDLLEFEPAQFQGTYYSGTVGAVEASLTLSPTLSERLFSGASAVLVLQNLGPTASLGLSSYTIPQDLTVSLSGGGLGTGAPVVQALLADPPPPGDVPEPGSGWLLTFGAALSFTAAAAMKRARRLKRS